MSYTRDSKERLRIACDDCGNSVSTAVPNTTMIRACVRCHVCVADEEDATITETAEQTQGDAMPESEPADLRRARGIFQSAQQLWKEGVPGVEDEFTRDFSLCLQVVACAQALGELGRIADMRAGLRANLPQPDSGVQIPKVAHEQREAIAAIVEATMAAVRAKGSEDE